MSSSLSRIPPGVQYIFDREAKLRRSVERQVMEVFSGWSIRGLVVIDEIAHSTARLIVNRTSFHLKGEAVNSLLGLLKAARASDQPTNATAAAVPAAPANP